MPPSKEWDTSTVTHRYGRDEDQERDERGEFVTREVFNLTVKNIHERYAWVNDLRWWAILAGAGGAATAIFKLIAK